MDRSSLTHRTGLPGALRVLLQDYPRETWPQHDHFHGLVSFWLDRHLMFRKLIDALRGDTESVLDGAMDTRQHAQRLQRHGSMLVSQLHGHHQIEDMHYFPRLAEIAPDLQKGFDLLDGDHHALDGLLASFTAAANGVLQGGPPGGFHDELIRFDRLIDRHLVDEEELIVPVILKHGPGGLD